MLDVRGRAFDFPQPPHRVVSLVPSLTETLFDLGAGADVVAITDFCIFPPDLALPRVGGTKNPRVEEIRTLRPDLVHMNLEENLRRHADAIETFAPVFVSEPKTVEDVVTLIEQLGAIHHRRERAAELADELRAQMRAMPRRAFTFACPIWKNPWMWCGGDTYVSHLVACAGGTNVLGDRERYPQIELEDVLALRPDIIFLPDEPYLFTEEDAHVIPSVVEGSGGAGGAGLEPPSHPDPSTHARDDRGGRSPRVIGPFPGHLFTWHGTRTTLGLRFLEESV